jgi:predicted lipid-binding transport protein (Tim44 family)
VPIIVVLLLAVIGLAIFLARKKKQPTNNTTPEYDRVPADVGSGSVPYARAYASGGSTMLSYNAPPLVAQGGSTQITYGAPPLIAQGVGTYASPPSSTAIY